MEAKDKKEAMETQSSENKTDKEVKGVVEDSPPTNNYDTSKRERNDNTMVKDKQEEPKGLPHQQVPQPGDFSTEAP
ncbi:hypothetical protein TIFTF001_011795 [Ficus carica]|uniref:Uncharacterized protein n=1 Tax=Ficus carica TaxID=3494 RepID=A0AA88DHY4_FICCA|nr:hypothetical protein TIFTF001_011795 [Ficus carica]